MTREETWDKAYKRIFELYGVDPDFRIVNRFLSEKAALSHFGVAAYFEELAGICQESIEKYNEKLVVKNTVCSCFTAYLLGASEINPLPPHYYCETCKHVEWIDEDDCVFDMRGTRTCECGSIMQADGYNLPYETYIPYAQKLKTKDPVPENYKDLFESLTKKHFQYSLLGAAQAVNLLGQATGVRPEEIDLSDCEVKYRLLGGDFICVSPKLATFLKTAYETVQPSNYHELLKLIGMAHGTQVWKNNAENWLLNGECKLSEIPATRDELYMSLWLDTIIYHQYDKGFTLDVTDKARKGFYFEHGMDGYTVEMLRVFCYDEWFIDYLLSARYMSTKAISVMVLKYIILLTWYQTYYPKQYAEVIGDENIWEGGQDNG